MNVCIGLEHACNTTVLKREWIAKARPKELRMLKSFKYPQKITLLTCIQLMHKREPVVGKASYPNSKRTSLIEYLSFTDESSLKDYPDGGEPDGIELDGVFKSFALNIFTFLLFFFLFIVDILLSDDSVSVYIRN